MKFINNIEKYLIWIFFIPLLAVMVAQVVARYCFGVAWGWAEPVSRQLFIYLTFAGISYCGMTGAHLRVNFLAEFLPGKNTKKIIFLIGDVVAAVILIILSYLLFGMMKTAMILKQTQIGAAFIPVWLQYFIGAIGLLGTAIRIIQFGIIPGLRDIKNGTNTSVSVSSEKEDAEKLLSEAVSDPSLLGEEVEEAAETVAETVSEEVETK